MRLLASRFSLLAVALVVACTAERSVGAFRGVAISPPLAKPPLTLTDFNGQPYDFAAQTRDKVALLFFGYTHCPDVCPLHMANIAAVLGRMPAGDRARVVTVFVTTDPERDTPARLKDIPQSIQVIPSQVMRDQQAFVLTDVVRNIAGINQALARQAKAIGFPAPITRDGPGWRADVDLPPGVTVGEVMDRRDKLASGLGRTLGCVWPEGNADADNHSNKEENP